MQFNTNEKLSSVFENKEHGRTRRVWHLTFPNREKPRHARRKVRSQATRSDTAKCHGMLPGSSRPPLRCRKSLLQRKIDKSTGPVELSHMFVRFVVLVGGGDANVESSIFAHVKM